MSDELFTMPNQPVPELQRLRAYLAGLHKLIAEIEDRTEDWLPDNDPLMIELRATAEKVSALEQAEIERSRR